MRKNWGVATLALVSVVLLVAASQVKTPLFTSDPGGMLETFTTSGSIDVTTPFFQNLGTNGRTCNSCHVSSTGWTVSPPELQERFERTRGQDPVFNAVDGTDCPNADQGTERARRAASSLLLDRGLIRISLPVPANADYTIVNIADPHHCAGITPQQPSVYRRPLPSTNLRFLTTVMWDGRENAPGRPLEGNLAHQALDATTGHAQGMAPSDAQQGQIVAAEMALFTAQGWSRTAGRLAGPEGLVNQEFYPGINDPLGGNPTGAPFNSVAFTLFDAWTDSPDPQRRSVARGETLFNTLPITITGVAGLNDLPGLETVHGFCTTCHDTPNVGNHSVPLAINIGVTDYPVIAPLDVEGLPVYTVRCSDGTEKRTTDLGRGLVTGRCADIGKTKGPILRGLASRAPYFHNGSAKTLSDAVDFYDRRFHLGLDPQQKRDLVAFLNSL